MSPIVQQLVISILSNSKTTGAQRLYNHVRQRSLTTKRVKLRPTNAAFESTTSRGPAPYRPRILTSLQWPVDSFDISVLAEPPTARTSNVSRTQSFQPMVTKLGEDVVQVID